MNQRELHRRDAQLDSRRVASGFICFILTGASVIGLLKRANIIPEYCVIDPTTGYDQSTGLAVVIANQVRQDLEDMLERLPSIDSIEQRIEQLSSSLEYDKEESIKQLEYARKEVEAAVVKFVRENAFLVYLSPKSSLGIPNASQHLVYLDSREDGPPKGDLVQKVDGRDSADNPFISWKTNIR